MKSLGLFYHHRMGIWIDTKPRNFHGYTVCWEGQVLSKLTKKPMKFSKRERRGGGFDYCVLLSYNGKQVKWTIQRLIGSCFLGNIDGLEMNHHLRNPENNCGSNLDIMTRSENQKHWRNPENRRDK